jgi:hypothetical protein
LIQFFFTEIKFVLLAPQLAGENSIAYLEKANMAERVEQTCSIAGDGSRTVVKPSARPLALFPALEWGKDCYFEQSW